MARRVLLVARIMTTSNRLPASELAPMVAVDPRASLAALVFDWAVIGVSIAAAVLAAHPAVSLLAIVVIGARQHALLIMMHEAAHLGLFRRRRVNDLVSDLLLAWPLFVSTQAYRDNHNRHHRHLNSPEDPDWVRYRDASAREGAEWRFPMSRTRLAGLFLGDALGLRTVQQLRKILLFSGAGPQRSAARRGTARRGTALRVGYYVALAAGLTLVSGWSTYLLYWIVPSLTSLKVLLRLRLIAEHILPDGVDGTRTTRTGWLARFFIAPHHIGLHYEHHAYPAVRFHQLPKLHARLSEVGYPRDAHLSPSYGAVLREVTNSTAGREDVSSPRAAVDG